MRLVSLLAVSAVLTLTAPALAQSDFFGGGPLSLLTGKDTAADLKLGEDQIKKFKELQAKMPTKLNDELNAWTKEVETAIDGLKDEQKKRLKQLQYQRRGITNFYNGRSRAPDADGIKALGVTDDEKKKLEEIATAFGDANIELAKEAMMEGYRQKVAELRKTYLEKFVAALSADAKKKYEELSGPAFKGEWPKPM